MSTNSDKIDIRAKIAGAILLALCCLALALLLIGCASTPAPAAGGDADVPSGQVWVEKR